MIEVDLGAPSHRGKAKSPGSTSPTSISTDAGLGVTIRRSKTDQEGEGPEIARPLVAKHRLRAASAVRERLRAANIVEGSGFPKFALDATLTGNRIDPDDWSG